MFTYSYYVEVSTSKNLQQEEDKMASKRSEINLFDERDYNLFDSKDLEKHRGRPKRVKEYRSIIYGSLSCGFLSMAVFEIWQGMSFIVFIGFLVATVLSIVIDLRTNIRS